MEEEKQVSILRKVVIYVPATIFILILLSSTIVKIDAGERGVVKNGGAVQDNIMQEGLHLKVPFYQQVIKIDVKTQKIEVEAVSFSKDIQTVTAVIALNYHIESNIVNKLVQEVAKDYESVIIQPAIQESVKSATAKFTAQELVEERPLVKEDIKISLKERLAVRGIIVDEFSIANFDFTDEYEKAVERKQVAQQDALAQKNKLEQVKYEAEQRVAQAEAEAKAIQIQAQAITQQGGEDYVQLKAIEKWNGSLPTQMIPGGTVPFLNLTK